jgi:hypothetical protein
MGPDTTISAEVFDRVAYLSALPWPHLVVDGLFDEQLIADAESQEIAAALRLPEHRSYRQVKAESSEVSGAAYFGPFRTVPGENERHYRP